MSTLSAVIVGLVVLALILASIALFPWPVDDDTFDDLGPRPPRFEPEEALGLIGWAGKVHPADVVAYLHDDREAANRYAELNAEKWGHPTTLRVLPDGKVLAVLDLRPAIARLGRQPLKP